jgi:hypothetical protein
MPINRLLQEVGSFGPNEVTLLVDAFEGGIGALGVDRNDPIAVALAKTIIALAQQGERDPVLLRERALKAVSQSG